MRDKDKDRKNMTPLGEAATQMHEMYMEFRRAGFSKKEALELVKGVVAAGMGQYSDNNE